MRLFISVACPEEVRKRLSAVQERLVSIGGMKAVEFENLHLTVKFLGDVQESGLDELKRTLSKRASTGWSGSKRAWIPL